MLLFSSKVSDGATALKNYMGINRIKTKGSKFIGGPNKKVINWGSVDIPPQVAKCKVLNAPEKIKLSSNKLSFFKKLREEAPEIIPDFAENLDDALKMFKESKEVVARTILNGSGGEGIVVMHKDNPDKFVKCSLYTRYIPKVEEYRIHVVAGKVIDVQRKTLKKEALDKGGEVNWKIRNLANGFIYQREGVNPSQEVYDAAIKAIKVIGLDFGGVDLVVHKITGKPYILEINTAPGLQGQTVESYGNAFKELGK